MTKEEMMAELERVLEAEANNVYFAESQEMREYHLGVLDITNLAIVDMQNGRSVKEYALKREMAGNTPYARGWNRKRDDLIWL